MFRITARHRALDDCLANGATTFLFGKKKSKFCICLQIDEVIIIQKCAAMSNIEPFEYLRKAKCKGRTSTTGSHAH
jgi:hypothetical protein